MFQKSSEVRRGRKVKGSFELCQIPSWTVISLCKFPVILCNIVTYCAILSNFGLFSAHQSMEVKPLSHSSLISSSTSSTWHTGFYLSPIGLKWRRPGKGPLLRSSRRLWLPSRTKCWKSTCGPKHVANSRRPGVLTSRSTSLNLLLVHLPTLPRLPLLRDRPVGQVDAILLEIIKWLYTQTSVLCCADASQ